jgi:hypothetical protein
VSRSILAYRPHAPHFWAHPDFTVFPLIRDALAVLVRLGDPGVVPCFRCPFLLDMPPSETSGSLSGALAQFYPDNPGLRRVLTGSALPTFLSSASDRAGISRLHYGSLTLRPVELFAPLADLTRLSPSHRGFYSRASDEAVTLLVVGYGYGGI